MTSDEAWSVSKRVLGAYFVVQAFLYAAEAVRMIGIVVPEGSSRSGYTSASLIKGAIAFAAGMVLLLRSQIHGGASTSVTETTPNLATTALQLLGVFFLIEGLVSFADPAVRFWLVRSEWSWWASQFSAAAVECLAGCALIVRSAGIASLLSKYVAA